MIIGLIVVVSIIAYGFTAGVAYAIIPRDFGSLPGDRDAVAWLWPIAVVVMVFYLGFRAAFLIPRVIGRRIEARRRECRLPRAEVRR